MQDKLRWINEIMDEHGDYLKRTAAIITSDTSLAEDLVQETFLNLYRNSNSFRREAKVRTYLYRILMNNIKMHYRKSKPKECAFEIERAGSVSFENETVDAMDINNAVSKLKPIYRQIVVLHYFDGMSIDEISEVMDIGNSAVKMRLKRAREQLRRHLLEGRDTV